MTMLSVGTSLAAVVLLNCLAGGFVQGAVCKFAGDPHITTFDSATMTQVYNCMYTLAVHTNPGDKCYFRSYIKQEPRFKINKKAFVEMVDIFSKNGLRYRMFYDGRLYVGNSTTPMAASAMPASYGSDGKVYKDGQGRTTVTSYCGATFKFLDKSNFQVNAPSAFAGKVKGLCGNFNSNPSDDLLPPGQNLTNYGGDTKKAIAAVGAHFVVEDSSPTPSKIAECIP